ncbi:hypothetical protein N836_31485 [Leptolyngbya sp. Heron Island J]|uniref:hypothetical protein n=1 Tax=Leptolyngbya sp. Heron Island J TaxID=1385935 RepID=UPI0003B9ED59|nr:hypothetical protein [Leptolyngbya sp. Heron Island J]ESA38465.1 hypothetical protein N836_31485 [Leptolyngbya sp. Heron Island J]
MEALIVRIVKEIRRGENIDLYIAIVTAIALLILGIFGISNPSWIASINISVLILITVSLLGNRYRIENIQKKLSESSHGVFQEKFPEDFEESISQAQELWIVGINLGTTSSIYFKNFRRILESRRKIKILILEPNGVANSLGAARYDMQTSSQWHRIKILESITIFCRLKEKNPEFLEIRTIDYIPSFGFFGVDPESSKGTLYIEHYGYRLREGDLPRVVLRPKDSAWYVLFQEQLFTLWNDGNEWNHNVAETEAMIQNSP